jgi:hypothetical protein
MPNLFRIARPPGEREPRLAPRANPFAYRITSSRSIPANPHATTLRIAITTTFPDDLLSNRFDCTRFLACAVEGRARMSRCPCAGADVSFVRLQLQTPRRRHFATSAPWTNRLCSGAVYSSSCSRSTARWIGFIWKLIFRRVICRRFFEASEVLRSPP